MRKSLLPILLVFVALFSATNANAGYSLTQSWKNTTVPTATNTRQGVFARDTFFVQNRTTSMVETWLQNSTAAVTTKATTNGSNICTDDAGNLIVKTGFGSSTTKSITVISADGLTTKTIALTGIRGGRNDYFGHASGDILSSTGGYLYVTPNSSTTISAVRIVNGAETADSAYYPVTGLTNSNGAATYSVTINGAEHIIVAPRSAGNSYFDCILSSDRSTITASKIYTPSKSAAFGCAIFTVGDTTYIAYPSGTNYADGFSIAKFTTTDANNAVIVSHAVEKTANTAYANWLFSEVVNDTTVNIYQYHPGGMFAKYVFTVPAKPVPDLYLIGSIDEASNSTTWDATKGCKMTYNATTKTYSATVNMTKAGGTFGVSKVIAENNDAGGWTYVNGSRFIPESDGLSLDYGVAKPMSAWESGKDYAWSFPILGKFKVVVDLNAMTIRDTLVTSVYPMNLYVIGNTNFSETWSTSVPLAKMTETADGVYSGAFKLNEVSAGNQYQYFSIVKNLGADWDAVNVTGNRFGPTADGTLLATDATVSTDFGNHNTAYKVPYTEGNNLWLTVDLTASTISANSNTTGVAGVNTTSAMVIAGAGEINVIGSARAIEVYTAAGALVSRGNASVSCAPGLYIVRVDGNVFKVLVK